MAHKSRALRLASAIIVTHIIAAGAATVTDDCCGRGSTCCPQPSIETKSHNLVADNDHKLRIVYDSARCCPADVAEKTAGCLPYGVAGCIECQNLCTEEDGDACVECPVDGNNEKDDDSDGSAEDGQGSDEHSKAVHEGEKSVDEVEESVDGSQESDDPDDDLLPILKEGKNDDFVVKGFQASYDFSDDPEHYECSNCIIDSRLEQRLLDQRSRSMVCDSSCLKNGGDANYGVTLCNYFRAGKECRTCCHGGHSVEGCMPCEGEGSCGACMTSIHQMCGENICDPACHAHVCCMMQWVQYSGCPHTTNHELGVLANSIAEECGGYFSCEDINPSCSDNARTCTATSAAPSRHLQETIHTRCDVLSVNGAGVFDIKYAAPPTLGGELVFSAKRGAKGGTKHFALQSIAVDACAGLHKLDFFDKAIADIIVAHSSTGSLVWDDGTEPHPHVMNTGAGCSRHMWFLRDTAGELDNVFVAVDESEHPQFITSDWVKVYSNGKISRTDLKLSCTRESKKANQF